MVLIDCAPVIGRSAWGDCLLLFVEERTKGRGAELAQSSVEVSEPLLLSLKLLQSGSYSITRVEKQKEQRAQVTWELTQGQDFILK